MKIDFDKIRQKYEKELFNFKHMFFPCSNPKRLLIFFSSMGKDRYDRWSWFFDDKELWEGDTACLFIKDDSFHYFLGTDEFPLTMSIKKLIDFYLLKLSLTNDSCFTIGGSMGGYAAIYYASFLSLNGAIVANPQINIQSCVAHKYDNWERNAREAGHNFKDLCMFIHKRRIPNIYIEYGNYYADKIAMQHFIESCLDGECLLILRKAPWNDHTVDCLSRFSILNAVFFFENHGFDPIKAPRARKNICAIVPDISSNDIV